MIYDPKKLAVAIIIMTAINFYVFYPDAEYKDYNVILIVVDCLRADALGIHNPKVTWTDNLDAFAADSIVFNDAVAPSTYTINSAPSILFSVLVQDHRYYNYETVVSEDLTSIAEYMKEGGYETYAVSTNPHVSSINGMSQGFETFEEDLFWEDTDADEVNGKFLGWLGKGRPSPYFAMLWYIDPHSPYEPPERYQIRHDVFPKDLECAKNASNCNEEKQNRMHKRLYDGEVEFFDREFEKLIEGLNKSGQLDKTIIIVTADHGESFLEKKMLGHDVKGHGQSLFIQETWVPLMMHIPGKKAKRIDGPVSLMDIVPTVLEMIGIDAKEKIRGRSLVPLIDGKDWERGIVLSQLKTDQYGPYVMQAATDGKVKTIETYQYLNKTFSKPKIIAFDVTDGEIRKDAQDISHLTDALEAINENVYPTNTGKVSLEDYEDERIRERLASLGYLDG